MEVISQAPRQLRNHIPQSLERTMRSPSRRAPASSWKAAYRYEPLRAASLTSILALPKSSLLDDYLCQSHHLEIPRAADDLTRPQPPWPRRSPRSLDVATCLDCKSGRTGVMNCAILLNMRCFCVVLAGLVECSMKMLLLTRKGRKLGFSKLGLI